MCNDGVAVLVKMVDVVAVAEKIAHCFDVASARRDQKRPPAAFFPGLAILPSISNLPDARWIRVTHETPMSKAAARPLYKNLLRSAARLDRTTCAPLLPGRTLLHVAQWSAHLQLEPFSPPRSHPRAGEL